MKDVTAVYLVKRSRTLPSGKKATYWVLRWSDSRGKMRSESIGKFGTMTKREAEKKRREKETALGSGRARRDRPQKMTLKQFLEMDRQAIAGDVSGSTLVEHAHTQKHAIAALGEDADVTRMGYADANRIKQHLTDAGKSPATISKTLRMLRAAFNRGIRAGLIHENPFTRLRLPRCESRTKRIFSITEIETMVKAAPNLWWRALIRLAVTSGLRKDEMLNLRWYDIDLDAKTVQVQPKDVETFMVDGRSFKTWKWSAKAKASYRTVPIPGETVRLLRRQQVMQGRSPYVFLDLDRIDRIQPHIGTDGKLPPKFELRRNMLRDFAVIQKRAAQRMSEASSNGEYEWRFGSIHDMRRTYCTHMANHVPMHVLKEWAGHADIATTAGFYLGLTDGMAEKARQAWGDTG